jgi:hypothetical protein
MDIAFCVRKVILTSIHAKIKDSFSAESSERAHRGKGGTLVLKHKPDVLIRFGPLFLTGGILRDVYPQVLGSNIFQPKQVLRLEGLKSDKFLNERFKGFYPCKNRGSIFP